MPLNILIHILLSEHARHHSIIRFNSVILWPYITDIAFNIFGTPFLMANKRGKRAEGQIGVLKWLYTPIYYYSTQYLTFKVLHGYICKYLTLTRFCALFYEKKDKREGIPNLPFKMFCLCLYRHLKDNSTLQYLSFEVLHGP